MKPSPPDQPESAAKINRAYNRLQHAIEQITAHTGAVPSQITLYAQDFDLLTALYRGDVKLLRGAPRVRGQT